MMLVCFFIAWATAMCLAWGWFPRISRIVTAAPQWWLVTGTYLLAVAVCALIGGSRRGGTFWGWWGTWLYAGALGPALFLLIAIWWSPASLIWRLLIAILALYILAVRPYIADLAFRRTLLGAKRLSEVNATPQHVFCATEMQTGRHAHFCRDFIYTWGAGVGEPANLHLSSAVQMSANFPVAFPYRLLGLKRFHFRLWKDPRRVPLVLSDGGVQDNTGVGWFLEASERNARLQGLLETYSSKDPETFDQRTRHEIERRLVAMRNGPDSLIVVNSSYPSNWKKQPFEDVAPIIRVIAQPLAKLFKYIPVLAELGSLVRIQAVMYDHRAREQSRELHRRFFFNTSAGAMVSIEQTPDFVYKFFFAPQMGIDGMIRLGLSDLPDELFQKYHRRARAVRIGDLLGPDHEQRRARLAKDLAELDSRIQPLEEQLAKLGADPTAAFLRDYSSLDRQIARLKTERHSLDVEFRGQQARREEKVVTNEADGSYETMSSWNVPTTFRPLGEKATADLLRHGYINCMNICHLLLDGFPRFADPPTIADMQQLARGEPRKSYPSSLESAAAAAS